LDINKIFGTFGSSSRDGDGFDHPTFLNTSVYNYEDEENHPRYFIRMFTKLILNYTNYNKQLIDLFGKSDPEIDVEEVVHTGESMLYDRAYYYLTQLDTQDTYHIKVLFEEANEIFEEALNKSLVFFEGKEEYEKCAILKGYLDFLNFSS
jgi:hypothetical protein